MREQIEGINIYKHPRLTDPCLIAAWPGIASVASTVVTYLRTSLGAQEFAEVHPVPFYDLEGAFVEDNLIQSARFPESKFYYWKNKQHHRDLIIFEGEAQPKYYGYQLAGKVVDFAQKFNVKRIYTLAAALVQQFSQQPRVWAAASDPELLEGLRSQGLVLKGNFYVAGMNGVLLSVAKEKQLEGICLLGETPEFPNEVGNPFAALSMLEALARVLELDYDLTELRESAKVTYEEIERTLSKSRSDFLDQFTVSLWDSSEDDDG